MDFSRQPLQGSDIAAFVFAVLALLFVVLGRRDRERGMIWLAIAYCALAVQYAFNDAASAAWQGLRGLLRRPCSPTVVIAQWRAACCR